MAGEIWRHVVRGPRDGEPATGAVFGRALDDLASRDAYLRARQEAAELGEAIVLRGRVLADDVAVQDVVYWDGVAARYDRAIAAHEIDATTGALVPAPSAEVVGIVAARNGTTGDIVALGELESTLSVNLGVPATRGMYYLSAADPGRLVAQRPPVSVPVLFHDGVGRALINPHTTHFLERHVHYRIDLFGAPAGVPVETGGHVTLDLTNAQLPGWLPADHPIFEGAAPAGARFGYNLSQHPELARIYPPAPLDACQLILDRGADPPEGGTFVRLGPGGTAILDANGIWWLRDELGSLPWSDETVVGPFAGAMYAPRLFAPRLFPTRLFPVADDSLEEASAEGRLRLTLGFATTLFATDGAAVTSLRAGDGSPITITDCDGQPAAAGDLVIGADLNLIVDPADDAAGAVVFKGFDGKAFVRGPVVEGLVAGPNVTITSTLPSGGGADAQHRGVVTVSADVELAGRELDPLVTMLGGVQERTQYGVPFLGFPAGRRATLTMKFHIPPIGLPAAPRGELRIWVLGSVDGTLPDLDSTCRPLPPPDPAGTQLPPADSPLELVIGGAIQAWGYRSYVALPVDVQPGGVLIVTLTRLQADGYAGEVGVLRCRLAIVE